MSELLTTGEMVDRLKVGEVAECVEKGITEVIKDDDGIWWYDKPSGIKKSYMTLLSRKLDYKWRILPNYVSFEEAMQALKKGEEVTLHHSGNEYKFIPVECISETITYYDIHFLEWRDLFNGKWTVKEEE